MLFSNNEISKNLAGSIGIFDEKSFVGSSEAGERLFEEFTTAFMREVMFVVNDELIPRMINYGFTLSEGDTFRFVSETKMDFKDKMEMIRILGTFFDLDAEQITEETGYTVTKKELSFDSVAPAVTNLYKPYFDQIEKFKKLIDGKDTKRDI
jgi:hypothetical protein